MKKKKNPVIIAIVVLLIALIGIIYLYVTPTGTTTKSSNKENTVTSSDVTTTKASTQTIENTLSSSGQISSALDEKIYLHASYYFEKMLVSENVYIKEGTNIIEYTNGTYLTAPYDCVIVGSNLPAEDEICTTSNYIEIKSIETLCMSLSVSESDINKIEIGDVVDITMTASGDKLEGYITSISEVGSYSSSGSYFTAVVTFENNGNLKIGMSATCEIIIERVENVVAVPLEAIQTSDDGSYVIVVNSDGTQANTTVETGISNDAYIEIKSGITVGTSVQMSTSSGSSSSSNFGGKMMYNRGGENDFGGGAPMEMPSGGMPRGGSDMH